VCFGASFNEHPENVAASELLEDGREIQHTRAGGYDDGFRAFSFQAPPAP
jgi:hypothetical protein